MSEGYMRLGLAIVYRAALDARGTNGEAAAARAWLAGDEWAGDLVKAVGLDWRWVRAWVQELEPVEQPALL
jgi:hypothetical protein